MRRLLTNGHFFNQAAACLLFFVLLGFILQYASEVLIPLTFSFLLTFIVLPLSTRLERWYFPNWLSAFIGIVIVMLVLGSVVGLLSYQISDLMTDMPTIKEKLNTKFLEFQKYIGQHWGYTVREQNNWLDKKIKSSGESVDGFLMGFFNVTTTFLTDVFLIPILSFFLLIYKERFKKFLELVDEKYHFHTRFIITEVGKVSQSYLKGMVIDILILTVLGFLGFWALGLEYALLFAVLGAILNIIPYVGVLLGSIFPIVMALITKDSAWYALGALGVCVLVQFLDNNFIGPKVIGSSVSINPLFSTLALLVGSLVWGMSGMVLAMPLAGMLKVVFDNMPELQPYGYLMGEEENFDDRPLAFKGDLIPYLRRMIGEKKAEAADN